MNGHKAVQSTQRVYLDVCALCRPFDDQTQMRIRLEADAVQLILSHIRSGDFDLVVSPAHEIEIDAIDEHAEREHLLSTLQRIGRRVETDLVDAREHAERLAAQGLGVADAAHLAFAEAAEADFVTCDDRLLRQCRRGKHKVWVGTPIAFCEKEDLQ